jgi:hypothetical protein
MVDPLNSSSFNIQPNFPIAGVADLIAQRPLREAQMRAQQQQQLVEGLKDFGTGVQSLVARRQAMAQALAGAQIYGQTPEGKQLLGTNQVTQGPAGPITQNQTAAFNPQTGMVTPNQSPVTPQTLATAFYGDKPSDLLNQLYERQKQAQQFGLEQRKQALAERVEPQKVAGELAIQKQLAGIKGQEIGVQTSANIQDQISSLQQKKAELVKALPGTFGTFLGNSAAQQAQKQIAEIDSQIAQYQSRLQGKNSPQTGGAAHMSTEDLLDQYRQLSNATSG